MKKDSKLKDRQVTDRQLHEAEEGLLRLLHAKRFPREWIERHAPEAMAQARTDFAVRLAADREDETVGLLVVIGYRRALKILRSQRSAPPTTSIENVFHLADESTATPEEEAIDRDREERVAKAMGHLPERERKLMALVYFEGMSIRAAGRRLGWGKSVANRHHQAALDRLNAMLDRSLLAPEIAIPAFVVTHHHSVLHAAGRWLEGVSETVREAPIFAVNRIGGFLETGNAAALSGAGRTASGLCGAVVVACVAGAATGMVGPGLDPLAPSHAHQSKAPSSDMTRALETSAKADPAGAVQDTDEDQEPGHSPDGRGARNQKRSLREPSGARRLPVMQSRQNTATALPAGPKQTAEEFGVEGGDGGEAGTARSEPVSENATISPQSPSQAESPDREAASSPEGEPSPTPEGGSEFGM